MHLLLEGAGGEHEIIAFGVILIAIMIFMPDGLVLGARRLYNNWRHRQPFSETSAEATARSAS